MVRRAARGKQRHLVIPGENRDIPPERLAIGNDIRAILRAKDAMHQDGSVGVGHASR